MNERLNQLRKFLKLSQEEFGSRLGVTGASISRLEKGERNITEQMIKAICREFNVDYIWLTSGDGEMFIENDDDVMELIDRIMLGENEFHKNLFKTFARLDESELAALESILEILAVYDTVTNDDGYKYHTVWFYENANDLSVPFATVDDETQVDGHASITK